MQAVEVIPSVVLSWARAKVLLAELQQRYSHWAEVAEAIKPLDAAIRHVAVFSAPPPELAPSLDGLGEIVSGRCEGRKNCKQEEVVKYAGKHYCDIHHPINQARDMENRKQWNEWLDAVRIAEAIDRKLCPLIGMMESRVSHFESCSSRAMGVLEAGINRERSAEDPEGQKMKAGSD